MQSSNETDHPLDRLLDGGLLLLLGVSTVMFGGRSGWGLLVTVALFSLLLVVWVVRGAVMGGFQWIRTPLDLPIAGFTVIILVQMLVGFPWGLNSSGVVGWAARVASENTGHLSAFPGTVDYYATRQALILFILYAGVFYLTVGCVRSRVQLGRFLHVTGMIGAAVTLYGLLEFLSGNHSIFGWKEVAATRLRGTFVNPDTYATYLVMVIPLLLATVIGLGARRRRRHRAESSAESLPGLRSSTSVIPSTPDLQSETPTAHRPTPDVPLSSIVHGPSTPSDSYNHAITQSEHSSPHPSLLTPDASGSLFDRHRSVRPGERESSRLVLGAGVVICIIAVVFTMSRGGIIGFLAGALSFVILLWMRESGYRRRLTGIGIVLAACLLIAWIGAEPIFSRFAQLEMDSGGRLRLYRLTLDLVKDVPILGAGFGTYERAFTPYASSEFTYKIVANHAHNEWLQVAAEGGLISLALLLLALYFLLRDTLLRPIFGILSSPHLSPLTPHSQLRHDPFNIALTFGCWAAVIGVAVHSFFDFPFRTPANGVLLAMILGVLVAASGMRFHTEYVEFLLPVRFVSFRRAGGALSCVTIGGVALFLVWTTGAGVFAMQAVNFAAEALKSAGGGQADKPWVVETSKNREALKNFEFAVALDPMNPEVQNRMARFKTQLGLRTWGAGLSPEGKFIAAIPDRAQLALGLMDEAIRSYAGSVRVAPPYATSWSGMGFTYGVRARIAAVGSDGARAAADVERALAAMRQSIAMNPGNRLMYEVLANYGFFRLETDKPEAAFADPIVREGAEAQRKAIDLDPTYLPDALTRILRFSREVEVIQFALPEHAVDALFAARLLEEQELWPQAKVLHRRAIELASDDAKPLYYKEYAAALTRRGEDAEVRSVLDVVLRFDPQNIELRLALAAVLTRLQMTAEALQAYQAALDLANAGDKAIRPPAPPPTSSRRIRTHLTREEQAFALLAARFPDAKPASDPITLALGGVAGFHHAQGRDDLAVPLWEKAVQRSPGDAPSVFGLAKSYDAVGAWGSAVEQYKKAIELNPASLEYRLTLAARYFANDMTFQCISLYRDILTLRPTLIDARLKLADAYIKIEQFPEAQREYERVLQLHPSHPAAVAGIVRLRGRF